MKKFLPLILLAVALGISYLLISIQPKAKKIETPSLITPVEYLVAKAKPTTIRIESEGILQPRIETQFISPVAGQVIEIGENFYPGRFFQKGEVLFKLDDSDYKFQVKNAETNLAQAELAFELEKALSVQAKKDWEKLNLGEANDLVLRKPQLKQAKKNLESAQVSLTFAQEQLEDTVFRAPYSGYLLSRTIDLGTEITGGMSGPIASAYSSGDAEIRLPLTESERLLIDTKNLNENTVRLYDSGKLVAQGKIQRIEASLNPNNRLFYAVALIENAFPEDNQIHTSEMFRGQYLDAMIDGILIDKAFTLPNEAIRESSTIYTITNQNQLVEKNITVISSNSKQVIVSTGLDDGDRVVVSPVPFYINGMSVKPILKP
jgi:RND family efflux transporter MFP subunit